MENKGKGRDGKLKKKRGKCGSCVFNFKKEIKDFKCCYNGCKK